MGCFGLDDGHTVCRQTAMHSHHRAHPELASRGVDRSVECSAHAEVVGTVDGRDGASDEMDLVAAARLVACTSKER